jgi:aspartate/methionine/tyrosine aminotransferase
MSRLGTETAFEVLARARALEAQGREIIHLEIGEPDFNTPSNIVEAGAKALRDGETHYSPSAGIPKLRQTIAAHVTKTRDVPVAPEQVVVTPGAKPIMYFSIIALCEPGDEVIYPNPGFPIYESMINFVGAKAVPAPLRESKQFRLDVDELATLVNDRTRLIILNSPANPTGGALTRSDLEAVAELAKKHDAVVLTDEVYCEMVYDGQHFSIMSLPDMAERTILLDGFSKTYAMTGWRLGYGVFPAELAPHITRLVTNSVSCTPSFTQYAGIEALTGPQDASKAMIAEFKNRRDFLVAGLNSIPGIHCELPAGAFYAFPNVEAVGLDCRTFADRLLQEGGVATLAGASFGQYGEGYVRLSYANSIPNLEKALNWMGDFVKKVRK